MGNNLVGDHGKNYWPFFCLTSHFIESINQPCLRRILFRLREISVSKRVKQILKGVTKA